VRNKPLVFHCLFFDIYEITFSHRTCRAIFNIKYTHTGAIMVFCFYVFGHATGVLIDLPPQFEGTWSKSILQALYYILPNFSNFDIRSEVVNGIPVAFSYVIYATIYGILYSIFFIYLATLMFQRKDV
jgi:hypothetical protein